MATEIGTAYLTVLASTKGMAKDIQRSFDGAASGAESSGGKAGSGFLSGVKGTVLKAAGIIGVGALVGKTMSLGMARATSIEGSQKKLEGLGHSASSVSSIMDSALKSVKGTAFGLGDAATVAASMAAAGVKNGDEMTKTLKTVADTAAISGRSLTDIGAIFGSVAARGKLQGDDMLQLMSSGVPVLQMLSKQLGKSTADVSKMVSKGEIDFATFSAAMNAGMGGAALKSGETFKGAMDNARAAMGRLGAAFMTPALTAAKPLLAGVTALLDGLTTKAKPLADLLASKMAPAIEKFSNMLTEIGKALSDGNSIGDVFKGLTGAGGALSALGALSPIGVIFKALAPVMPQIADAIQQIVTALMPAVPVLAEVAGVIAGALSVGLAALLPVIIPIIVEIAKFVGWLLQFKPLVYAIVAALTVWKIATLVSAAAQWAMNLALLANPIGLVVAAIALLVAGLIYFFTQTETGKKAWTSFTQWLGETWNKITTWFSELPAKISAAFSSAGEWLKDAGKAIIEGLLGGISGAAQWIWDKIKEIGSGIASAFKSVLGINSPSKVMMELGGFTGEGFKLGLEAETSGVLGASAGLANAAIPDSSITSAPSMPSAGSGAASGDDMARLIAAVEAGQQIVLDGRTLVGETNRRTGQELTNGQQAETRASGVGTGALR